MDELSKDLEKLSSVDMKEDREHFNKLIVEIAEKHNMTPDEIAEMVITDNKEDNSMERNKNSFGEGYKITF
ncbi:hypothetical protein [Clostridium sp. C2-6-12]|uniref:hypothetical protein n=1 Tax=Clostridium sp. C2-6-12 TaxID=2698832 RepID=UPI00136A6B11|nr:hypothetical protein [Clostridium sp. C2-6-12]